ncbi:MAG: hypothetical protein K2X66_17405, partial [Cyanobacteria bacterium]|nr:hypothetical protein [Cyanobacteriota bacterium]
MASLLLSFHRLMWQTFQVLDSSGFRFISVLTQNEQSTCADREGVLIIFNFQMKLLPSLYFCVSLSFTMNARHAAREIALLVLFQLTNKDGEFLPAKSIEINKVSLQQMLLASVRAMVSLAKESIKAAAEDISKVTVSLVEMEQEHPSNLATPLNAPVQPVPLPNSRELIEKLETCLQAAEILYESTHF